MGQFATGAVMSVLHTLSGCRVFYTSYPGTSSYKNFSIFFILPDSTTMINKGFKLNVLSVVYYWIENQIILLSGLPTILAFTIKKRKTETKIPYRFFYKALPQRKKEMRNKERERESGKGGELLDTVISLFIGLLISSQDATINIELCSRGAYGRYPDSHPISSQGEQRFAGAILL